MVYGRHNFILFVFPALGLSEKWGTQSKQITAKHHFSNLKMDQLMIGSLIIGSTVRSTNTQCVYDQLGSTWIPHDSSIRRDLDLNRRSTQRQVAFFDLAKDYAFEPLGEGWSGDDRMVDVKKGRWKKHHTCEEDPDILVDEKTYYIWRYKKQFV